MAVGIVILEIQSVDDLPRLKMVGIVSFIVLLGS
jgi:hypothetical protein